MILRVTIDNLVIVDHAEFEPGPGLTCVTGETGAGKTLLAGAIALLFGAAADASQVGARGDQAWVEGEFEVPQSFWHEPSVAALAELRPEGEETLVLARRVSREGRSRALAWGRGVSRADLAAAGRLLVVTAGQHAQRRLLSTAWQRELLDRTGDDTHAALCERMAARHRELEAARLAREEVVAEAARVAGHAAQVLDDLSRIDAVDPGVDDERELLAARSRARHHAVLHDGLAGALGALGGPDGSAVVDALGSAWSAVDALVGCDDSLAPVAAQLLDAQQVVGALAADVRDRLGNLEDAPAAIDEIEERLGAYDDLHRRFGGTTEAVLARREELGRQASLIDGSDAAVAAADAEVQRASAAAVDAASALGASRRALAAALAANVSGELADLGMADTVFTIVVDEAPLSATGGDAVEMRSAPSAEIAPRPIGQVASGGELSRIALALHVATGSCEAGTIIFDEVDAGIGGTTAHAIGERLRRIAAGTQVICITHLAQVAARADTNVHIAKAQGHTTLTTLIDDDEVLVELCRMMGADPHDAAARETARRLRSPRFERTVPEARHAPAAPDGPVDGGVADTGDDLRLPIG